MNPVGWLQRNAAFVVPGRGYLPWVSSASASACGTATGNSSNCWAKALPLRVDAQAGDAAAAEGVLQQEVQAVAARQVPAADPAGLRVEHMLHPVHHRAFLQRLGDPRQVLRTPRHDPDVAGCPCRRSAPPPASPAARWRWRAAPAWRLARLGQSCRVEGFEDRQFQRMALAVDLHAQRALRLVDQEREQADHRIHRRPAADDAGQAGRHPGGGLGDLAGEQHQGFCADAGRPA